MQIESTDIANPYPRWLANLGLFLSAVSLLIFLWEWFSICVMRDSSKIAEYGFGSDSMMEKGGTHYASAELYSHTMLVGALAGIPGIVAFCLAVNKKTAAATIAAYATWIGAEWISSFL